MPYTDYAIVYEVATGLRAGFHGLIDKTLPKDGSTMPERVEAIASKSGRAVIYLPVETVFDPDKQKIADGKIIPRTLEDEVKTEVSPVTKMDLSAEAIQTLEAATTIAGVKSALLKILKGAA